MNSNKMGACTSANSKKNKSQGTIDFDRKEAIIARRKIENFGDGNDHSPAENL